METPILDIDSPLSLIMKSVDPVNWQYLTTHSVTKHNQTLKIVSQESDCWLCCEKNDQFMSVRARDIHLYDIERCVPILDYSTHGYPLYFCPNMLMIRVKNDDDRKTIQKLNKYFFRSDLPDDVLYAIIKNEYSIFEVYKECQNLGVIVEFNYLSQIPII